MSDPLTKTMQVVAVLGFALFAAGRAQAATEERDLPTFTRIAAQGGIDVHITQANRQRVRIETEDYELEDVEAEVFDGELRLSNRQRRGFSFFEGGGDVDVYLDVVELSAIRASGGSDVEGESNLRADELSVEASGGSDVELTVQTQRLALRLSGGSDANVRGTTQSLTVEASGGSDVSAGGLEAEEATVRVSGGSDATVWASAAIDVNASGGSDVSVRGNPSQRTVNNDRSSDIVVRR